MRKQAVAACPRCSDKKMVEESELWRIPAGLAFGPYAAEETCKRGHEYVVVLSMRGHMSYTPEEFDTVRERLGFAPAATELREEKA